LERLFRIHLYSAYKYSSYPNIGHNLLQHTGYYELLKYYISWYKYGVQPKITRDAVFYAYRPVAPNSDPNRTDTLCSLGPVNPQKLFGKLTNDLYVTTALVSAGQLRVITGDQTRSYDVPAGVATTNVPFDIGDQAFELWHDDRLILRSDGLPIAPSTLGDNFNVFSAYEVAEGSRSSSWLPSDAWKQDFVAEWFRQ
jgi:hypothetical protein